MATITAFTPETVDSFAADLGLHRNPERAERVGAEAAWVGFGEYDDFADGLEGALTLIYDYGEWPHWCHWAGVDTDGHGMIATYCEGDWYLYRFADVDAAEAHIVSEHSN